MREELKFWADNFPIERAKGDDAFTGSQIANFTLKELPTIVEAALPDISGRYLVKASPGRGQWTLTPWLAVLDPGVTTSVQENYYIVYLMNSDGSKIYLTLNQGCTKLFNALGIRAAREELVRRSSAMRSRLNGAAVRFAPLAIDLDANVWRADLYAAGAVLAVEYQTAALPAEQQLIDDLREALRLYAIQSQEGGWDADDEILNEADAAGKSSILQQAKRYRQHRVIERQSSHSKAVKRALGYRCMGCAVLMSEAYGDLAKDLIEAHHLTPLGTLADAAVVTFDPKKDFAVLCPNCHSVIHRMDDPSDLDGLRKLISAEQ